MRNYVFTGSPQSLRKACTQLNELLKSISPHYPSVAAIVTDTSRQYYWLKVFGERCQDLPNVFSTIEETAESFSLTSDVPF